MSNNLFDIILKGRNRTMEKKELLHQKKEEAREQFKDMLLLVVAGQKAGYSVENAFLKSYEDMNSLYGKDSSICK